MEPTFATSKKASRDKVLAAFKFIAGDEDADLVDAKAGRTILQYASAWRVYLRWCEEHGRAPIPAPPSQLRDYLRSLSKAGRSPATLDSYLAAIATVHRYAGYAIDRTILIEPMKAARRRAGPQRRARALTGKELKKLVGRLGTGTARDARDAVILLLGYAAALRGAELVGLDWLRPGSTLLGGTGVLSIEDDGLLVTLATSKASQVTPVSLAIPAREMPSLRAWVDRWVAHANVQAGEPIFRAIDSRQQILPSRLAPDAVARIIKVHMLAYAKATGLSETEAHLLAMQYSSHSLRRGYCSSASEARVPLGQIRTRSRHGSDATLGKYIRSAEGWRSSGLGKVGF